MVRVLHDAAVSKNHGLYGPAILHSHLELHTHHLTKRQKCSRELKLLNIAFRTSVFNQQMLRYTVFTFYRQTVDIK